MRNQACNVLIEDLSKGRWNEKLVESLIESLQEYPEDKQEVCQSLEALIGAHFFLDIWIYSILLCINPNTYYFQKLSRSILDNKIEEFTWGNEYFIFRQLANYMFVHPELNTKEDTILTWSILKDTLNRCKGELGIPLGQIPYAERDQDLVVVLVEQFLDETHGPTKTVLDRCYVLQKYMHKKVLLINTAEMLPMEGAVPFYDASYGNYVEKYLDMEFVTWRDVKISYYQCENNMPNLKEIGQIVAAVQKLKPYAIIQVGVSSLLAGVLNELVPVLTVGTIQSGLAMTLTDYQIIDQNMLEKGYDYLRTMDMPEKHIIPGRFTFSLKEQKEFLTRKDLGIEEDEFAVAMVGGRLTEEITEEFLAMLEQVVVKLQGRKFGAYIVGNCTDYEEKIKGHPALNGYLHYLGFCTDIMSRMEHMNLYINPTRRGGGTSAVEAMVKGKPVVTVNYGDVAGIVGEDFCVENYKEVAEKILRYMGDVDYYQEQSKKALALGKLYLDSETEFQRIMGIYEELLATNQQMNLMEQIDNLVDENPFKISVIIPCYNVEAYVGRCIDSILNQSIGYENLQIILVNDGSKDNTLDVLLEYEAKYPEQIMVINQSENAGVSIARNTGISYAMADVISFIDGDDWIHPDMYKNMYEEMCLSGAELVVCEMNRPTSLEEGDIFEKSIRKKLPNRIRITSSEVRKMVLREQRLNIYPCNKLFRKKLFFENDIWYPDGLLYEDNYVGYLLLLCTNIISFMSEEYYHWYQNVGSTTKSNKRYMDRLQVQTLLLNKIKEMDLYEEYQQEIDYNCFEKAFVETVFFHVKAEKTQIDLGTIAKIKKYVLDLVPNIKDNMYFNEKQEIENLTITKAGKILIQEDITDANIIKYLKSLC